MSSNRNIHNKTRTGHINRQAVYDLISDIPPGKVITYGQLATLLGNSHAARGIGKVLNQNPLPILVPATELSARRTLEDHDGKNQKISLLLKEGIPIDDDRIKDFEKYKI